MCVLHNESVRRMDCLCMYQYLLFCLNCLQLMSFKNQNCYVVGKKHSNHQWSLKDLHCLTMFSINQPAEYLLSAVIYLTYKQKYHEKADRLHWTWICLCWRPIAGNLIWRSCYMVEPHSTFDVWIFAFTNFHLFCHKMMIPWWIPNGTGWTVQFFCTRQVQDKTVIPIALHVHALTTLDVYERTPLNIYHDRIIDLSPLIYPWNDQHGLRWRKGRAAEQQLADAVKAQSCVS